MLGNGLLIGGVEFVLSTILGLVVLFVSYQLFLWLTPGTDEEREIGLNNRAVAITLGATLLSVGIIVREAIDPVMSTVQDLVMHGERELGAVLVVLGRGLLFVAIAFIAAVAALALAVRAFARLAHRFDHETGIRAGNESLAILYAAVTIVLALFIANGAGDLVAALIPEPTFRLPLVH
jgi:uncharacterized membrane protein YjfL (UPF0719 family)